MKRMQWMVAMAAGTMAMSGLTLAQDKKPADKPADKPATPGAKAPEKGAAPAAAPADMEMSPEMIAAMTPGEMHAKLGPMAGNWTFKIKMWMGGPDAPPMEAEGTAAFKWVMDGRYMHLDIKSPSGPMGPFEGMGVLGYDNVKQRYHSTWFDSGNTGAMTMSGKWDEAGKKIVWQGKNYDIFEGREVETRAEMGMTDANTIHEVAYVKGADGKEMKTMELTYTRVK